MNEPTAENSDALKQPGLFRSLIQLVRLPAVFTVIADGWMAFLISNPKFHAGAFIHLLGASICYYWSGMVLNDLFDAKQDSQERPERPIPSGRISARAAAGLGFGLLLFGMAFSWFTGSGPFRLGLCLAGCIVLYDAIIKKTPVAPLAMGACRFFNILMVAGFGLQWAEVWTQPQLQIATGFGIYIVGVTLFARSEAALQQNRFALFGGAAVILLGVGILAQLTLGDDIFHVRQSQLLFAVIAIGLALRLGKALRTRLPLHVQQGVRSCLMTIITLDAVLIYCLTGNTAAAVGCVLLVIPAIGLGRWISVT